MSNKKQKTSEEINWSEIQKKCFAAMMAFDSSGSSSNSNKTSADSFWVNAMEQWWKSVRSDSTIENEALFEKVIDQCHDYYFMSEQFSGLIEGMMNAKDKNEDVKRFINKKFKEIESMLSATQTNFSWGSIIDDCEQSFEFIKTSLSNTSLNSDDVFNDLNPEIRRFRDKLQSIPGVGYSREKQNKILKVIKLWALYQDNNQEYQSVMAQLSHDALELMRKQILRMTKTGEKINSMRQIYDLWIESNETVYSKYVFTKEYSELNGRLVNSLMAFKKQNNEIIEDILSAMNMPTNKAINDLERRQYELHKHINAMQSELKNLRNELYEKNTKTVRQVKENKPVSQIRSKPISNKTMDNSKVVQIKPAKKKVRRGVKSEKKKVKQKSSSANNSINKIKF